MRIRQLQAKHFAKWLQSQINQFGATVEVGSTQICPVETWVEEVTGEKINFICGGEIERNGNALYTDWSATCYYMMDEEGLMVTEAVKMLEVIKLDNPEAYLIAR